MSTYDPRPPYSPAELSKVYPATLQLKLVQVLFRHGERTHVSARFQNEGVPVFWPYCKSASLFKSAILSSNAVDWTHMPYRRQLETMGRDGKVEGAMGKGGEVDDLCMLGELTDKGRQTTLALGERLKTLYMDQLGFLPKDLSRPEEFYFRSSPVRRTLTSLQQVLTGIYPTSAPYHNITIHSRPPQEENLFPNESNCRRFAQLSRAFALLAEQKWNTSPEVAYLQSQLGPYVDGPVAVNGHPRLSGIMDTVNATLAHGEEVRLPPAFYDPKVREILERINIDEWYRGYNQSSEYRRLGVGNLVANLTDRMMEVVEGAAKLKLALYGAHDTTLSAVLASLGGYDGKWPPFSSSIAFELFQGPETPDPTVASAPPAKSWFAWLTRTNPAPEADIPRDLSKYYVRLRYNETPLVLKGCRPKGRHLEGDESLCTLAAFKAMVDKMSPKDWHLECSSNLDKEGIPPVETLDD